MLKKWRIWNTIRKLCPRSKVMGEFRAINDGGTDLPGKIAVWLRALNLQSGEGEEKEYEVYKIG